MSRLLSSSPGSAASPSSTHVEPLLRSGSYILTRDTISFSGQAHCVLPTKRCVAERLGRFALSCPCAVGDDLSPLRIDESEEVRQLALPALPKSVFLGACTMVRGDDAYLVEWLGFHVLLGIQLFVIYSDEPDASKRHATRLLLAPYIRGGQVVFIEERITDGAERQFVAINHCVTVMHAATKWVAVFDVDEFFVPARFDSLTEAIRALAAGRDSVASLFVPQAFFGALPTVASEGRVTDRFQMREESFRAGLHESSGKLVGKSIIRRRWFRHMHTSHNTEAAEGSVSLTVAAADVHINHYVCRTRLEQSQRERQGASWTEKTRDWTLLCEDRYVRQRDDDIARFKGVM